MAALSGIGAEVILASGLRSRDGDGDAETQQALLGKAEFEVSRLVSEGKAAKWQAWLTYHNYYKAPDLIGPRVARALDIPYLLIEASRARSRLSGRWADFAAAAETATDAADVVFYFTEQDAEALRRDAPGGQKLVHLRPFLNLDALPPASPGNGPMLSVGMMREGDKLASYRIIAETLGQLQVDDWELHIAGDGPARQAVAELMRPFADRITFLGALETEQMAQAYAQACLLFWPGVNEAFGLAYLEAQAAGLPVVAQDRPGVRDVLAPGVYPPVEAGTAPLADRLAGLLSDDDMRRAAGDGARAHVARHHLLASASETLREGLALCGVAP